MDRSDLNVSHQLNPFYNGDVVSKSIKLNLVVQKYSGRELEEFRKQVLQLLSDNKLLVD